MDTKNEETVQSFNYGEFEKLYIQVRRAEQRLYSDEEVKNLPSISSAHPHAREWEQRKKSIEKFIKYLEKKQKQLTILEIGCGNGWFSAQLARNPHWKIVGIDINKEELTQAKRVFDKSNLEFIEADIHSGIIKKSNFDIIVLASSAQYFPSLEEMVKDVLQFLKTGAELHILDTAFYNPAERDKARKRSSEYFTGIGFPQAASYYYHHSLDELESFQTDILYDPGSMLNKFRKNKIRFPWVRIKKGNVE